MYVSLFRIVKVALWLIFPLTLVCSCEREFRTASSSETWNLSVEELERLKRTADRGDSRAASRVSYFYSMTKVDETEGLRWMKIAAENGDENAREVLLSFK